MVDAKLVLILNKHEIANRNPNGIFNYFFYKLKESHLMFGNSKRNSFQCKLSNNGALNLIDITLLYEGQRATHYQLL